MNNIKYICNFSLKIGVLYIESERNIREDNYAFITMFNNFGIVLEIDKVKFRLYHLTKSTQKL